jgi:hypothetical protein
MWLGVQFKEADHHSSRDWRPSQACLFGAAAPTSRGPAAVCDLSSAIRRRWSIASNADGDWQSDASALRVG